ncbi:MAG: AAA family ATPase [Actinomycetota bacterium]|nr:AAA family ATPase [Actinomycetota bacterium]
MIVAFYGKGGIGKSTIVSNLSALLADKGRKVLQIGCDPKHDSTYALAGYLVPTVTELLAKKKFVSERISAEEIIFKTACGVDVVEAGGPEAGKGCGGYVVGETVEILKRLGILGQYDYVFFDVLGDIVCGGFAVPMQYSDRVYIIAGNDFDSIFAANRISAAVAEKGHFHTVRLAGIIGNRCDEANFLEIFCKASQVTLVTCIPTSELLKKSRQEAKTIFDLSPKSKIIHLLGEIAAHLMKDLRSVNARIIPERELFEIFAKEVLPQCAI